MTGFNLFQPTEIIFGAGRLREIGEVAARFGKNCLLVTGPRDGKLAATYDRVKALLGAAGLNVNHFDGVIPNPTTDVVTAGAAVAKAFQADVVIGIGGGSSMDSAKAIAVEASHEGTAWDYLHYKTAPGTNTLPIIVVSTTSGTGSQTTPCAVITNTLLHDKSAIWHNNIYPRAAIIDPELMLDLPEEMTAMTGFDAFCHNFEALVSVNCNPIVETLALEAIRLIIKNLPAVLSDRHNLAGREALAWADTLGGINIANCGVTLPHGLGMQISGFCPKIAHGQSLALTYPEFTRFTWPSAVRQFAMVGRLFDSSLADVADDEAARLCCDKIDRFLQQIGLFIGFADLGVSLETVHEIAAAGQVLSDYKNNPRVATLEEMDQIMTASFPSRKLAVS